MKAKKVFKDLSKGIQRSIIVVCITLPFVTGFNSANHYYFDWGNFIVGFILTAIVELSVLYAGLWIYEGFKNKSTENDIETEKVTKTKNKKRRLIFWGILIAVVALFIVFYVISAKEEKSIAENLTEMPRLILKNFLKPAVKFGKLSRKLQCTISFAL